MPNEKEINKENYKTLKLGDKFKPGDEFQRNSGEWVVLEQHLFDFGHLLVVTKNCLPARRKEDY